MSDFDLTCPVCGYYCLGNGGLGCIDKPALAHNPNQSRRSEMSNDYRNNTPPERVQANLKALKEAYEANTVGRGATAKPRDNMADAVISRELDVLTYLASQVEENVQRRLAPVSLGCPTQPDEPTKYPEMPSLFNSYYYQIKRVRESLKCIQEFIASVQISEP